MDNNTVWEDKPESKHENPCFKKAEMNEPIFVLRAQDISAAAIIQVWISMNPQVGPEKLAEAQRTLEAFRAWPKKKAAD